jgi:nickel/cobalt exporter
MTPLAELLRQGSAHAWLFLPSAILLGALHGLEPGHSKTMMAAFIIAVRGTVAQAVLLGLAATFSHTLVVWAIALAGMGLGSRWSADATEPYFQVASAVLIIAIAGWMIQRTRREQLRSGDHQHRHGAEVRRIETGQGVLALEVFEAGVPPRWRIHTESGPLLPADAVLVTTQRPDGTQQEFSFADRDDWLESTDTIPEPHEFLARLRLVHDGSANDYDVAFIEHPHHHDPLEPRDAHALAHAEDIRRRFATTTVSTAQIVMFGLTGGLIPCPAAITVLLLCLQLRQFTLGVTLVLCFSIGLAITMVTAGIIAALSARHIARRWPGFGALARRAPYFSGAVIVCMGLYVGWQGLANLG